jgi:hypothetical protein
MSQCTPPSMTIKGKKKQFLMDRRDTSGMGDLWCKVNVNFFHDFFNYLNFYKKGYLLNVITNCMFYNFVNIILVVYYSHTINLMINNME